MKHNMEVTYAQTRSFAKKLGQRGAIRMVVLYFSGRAVRGLAADENRRRARVLSARVVVPFRDFSDEGLIYNLATTMSAPGTFDWNRVSKIEPPKDGGSVFGSGIDNSKTTISSLDSLKHWYTLAGQILA
jgi:hypothetical protein